MRGVCCCWAPSSCAACSEGGPLASAWPWTFDVGLRGVRILSDMTAVLPGDLVGLAEDAEDLGSWLGALGLRQLLPLLDEWGAEHPADLVHLESEEVEQLYDGLKLVQKRKLQKALHAIRRLAGCEDEPQASVGGAAEPPAAASAPPTAAPPEIERLSKDEVAKHAGLLRDYAAGSAVAQADALRSLHASWTACVADPSVRPLLLPSLFAIAKREKAGAVEREAALALIFLAFSLSGTVVKVDEEPRTPTKGAQHAQPPAVVLILGWLGSGVGDFDEVAQHYRQHHPGCKIVTSVGGNDRWARRESADKLTGSPPLFAEGSDASWPAAALCEQQLWDLSSHMLPSTPGGESPAVFFHLFSNNGFMLYARLLCHLMETRGAIGQQAIQAIRGVLCDSTPDPAYDPPLLKQVAVASVASVLKKEQVGGMSIRDLGMRTPLRAVVHAACEHAQDPVFDSTWHYEWLRQHEPLVPCLFVYSVTDRTIRQEAIELWMQSNSPTWSDSLCCLLRYHSTAALRDSATCSAVRSLSLTSACVRACACCCTGERGV